MFYQMLSLYKLSNLFTTSERKPNKKAINHTSFTMEGIRVNEVLQMLIYTLKNNHYITFYSFQRHYYCFKITWFILLQAWKPSASVLQTKVLAGLFFPILCYLQDSHWRTVELSSKLFICFNLWLCFVLTHIHIHPS